MGYVERLDEGGYRLGVQSQILGQLALDPVAVAARQGQDQLDRLARLDGVGQVQLFGSGDYSMRIWLDRRAMAARGVTPQDVANRIAAENVELPAGEIETADQAGLPGI